MSRSVALAVLLGTSLFSVLALAGAEIRVLPFALASTDAPRQATLPAASQIVTDTMPTTDLSIQVSEAAPVVPGETTAYTLTIRNQGPAPATGIVVTNVLAKDVTPIWTRPAQPWCDRQERSVNCTIGDVRSTDATTITLDLSVGGTQTHVTNTQLAGVTLDLSTPNCSIDASEPSVTCRMTKLPAGADAQIRVGARVDAPITNPLVNSASVTANQVDPNPSNNRATSAMTVGAAAPATFTPAPMTTNLVMQAEGPTVVIAGQPFTYTYTITNRGETDATSVQFVDALPSTANLYDYSPGLPRCEQQGDVFVCTLRDPDSGKTMMFNLAITGNAGQPLRVFPDPLMPGWPICSVLKERTWLHIVKCELGTLERGQTTHVQLGLVAIGVQERTMENGAFVSARETDIRPSDNAITATMAVKVRSDLSIRSALSGRALVGKSLTYTLTIANNGPSDAEGVVVTDTLPLNARFVSAVPSQGDECRLEPDNSATDTVTCRLGPLGRAGTATVTIMLDIDDSSMPSFIKSIDHSATVRSDQTDPDLSDNSLKESIPINTGAKE